MLSRAAVSIKTWVAKLLIRRYLKRLKLSDSHLPPSQEIDNLQRQIALLKAMQSSAPNISLFDQLKALEGQRVAPPPSPSPSVEPPGLTLTAPVAPVPAHLPVASITPPAPEPEAAAPEVLPDPPEIEPAMTPITPETPVTAVPAAPAAPVSTGSKLPDVKMLAPILKIAMATLSIEQMVEIGLHVKMGAPGFQQFLDSEIARTKFRELYAVYCDFLAGKVK